MAEDTKFTPGPWGYRMRPATAWRSESRRERLLDAKGEDLYFANVGICNDEAGQANTCLIAAAPEMYAILQEYVGCDYSDLRDGSMTQRMKAILAKARGEEPPTP